MQFINFLKFVCKNLNVRKHTKTLESARNYITSLPNKKGSYQRMVGKEVISAPRWKRGHLSARLEKVSSRPPVVKGVISAPSWKRSHLGVGLEKVPCQRPVEKGSSRERIFFTLY